jgi:hydroxymethylpyrimidine/phosphomethylpyrimidine kinase
VLPTALAIAGLDPSGGAGLAADLRAFAAAGAWGAAVCAALTVQSTRGVRKVVAVPAALVVAQAEEVLGDARVLAIKTGALGSAANAHAVARLLAAHPRIPAIVDPVMIPSRHAGKSGSGSRLDGSGSLPAMRRLARAATLITPNLAEAGALLGEHVASLAEARDAAVALVEAGARAALVKGGHGGGEEAVDWLVVGGATIRVVRIAGPRRKVPPLHGTGCTLASLIAGRLAVLRSTKRAGRPISAEELVAAVRWARGRLDAAIRAPLTVGGGLRVLAPWAPASLHRPTAGRAPVSRRRTPPSRP